MSTPSEFLIDLERGEICALERFLERSGSVLTSKSLEASSTVLSSALQAMYGARFNNSTKTRRSMRSASPCNYAKSKPTPPRMRSSD
jgi:hypothetical protein